jgi:hypothetical protein
MSLGHRTHLKPKGVGENSMFGKPECRETAKWHVQQGPDDMVKAILPEPQCPCCKSHWSDTADEIRCSPKT